MSESIENQHKPITDGSFLKCAAPDCHYALFTTHNFTINEGFWEKQFLDHARQYEPGRAPDITVDWEISACCSVCPDRLGDVKVNDSDTVRCDDCGTVWAMDGTLGERDEDPA